MIFSIYPSFSLGIIIILGIFRTSFSLTEDVDEGLYYSAYPFLSNVFSSFSIGLVEEASEALTSTKRRSSAHTPFSAPSQLRACSIPNQRKKTKREWKHKESEREIERARDGGSFHNNNANCNEYI